jgi:hypothetical protein
MKRTKVTEFMLLAFPFNAQRIERASQFLDGVMNLIFSLAMGLIVWFFVRDPTIAAIVTGISTFLGSYIARMIRKMVATGMKLSKDCYDWCKADNRT